jgi:hypothetical protein
MDTLEEFVVEADKKSPFLKIVGDEPVTGMYKGATVVDDQFNPGKKTVQYALEIDGVTKTFKSGSNGLARQMLKIKKDTMVTIVRSGESFKTKWDVIAEK